MPPEILKYLRDMLDSATTIAESTSGRTAADYLADRMLRDAVQWNFCIIGEALSQLKKRDESAANQITDCMKIIGFRNQLIHGYGIIDHQITWEIITNKLPTLKRELEQLLASGASGSNPET